MWYYELRGNNNRIVQSKGGFTTEQEAAEAGEKRVEEINSSTAYPGAGGKEALLLTTGREKIASSTW